MKHLDEISSSAFIEMKNGADAAVSDMIKYMLNNKVCPICACYLMAEAAKAAAIRLERKTGHAKTH